MVRRRCAKDGLGRLGMQKLLESRQHGDFRMHHRNMSFARIVATFLILSGSVWADEGSGLSKRHDFKIPAQPLDTALLAFSDQAKVQVLMWAGVREDARSPGVSGELTSLAALKAILGDTGLAFQEIDKETVAIVASGRAQLRPTAAADAMSERMQLAQVDESTGADSPVAQEGSEEGGSDRSGRVGQGDVLQEVIVTATKREERVKDVPFSITALGEADLERTGADSFNEYLAQVPGVYFDNLGSGRGNVVLRGINTTSGGGFANQQSTSEVYIDEIPTLSRFAIRTVTDLNTFDVNRIEVLRGPQGSLFGSGSVGGAVRIITNKPDPTEFASAVEGTLSSTEGGEENYSVDAMLNVPLIADKMALRVIGYYRDKGGYIDNIFPVMKNYNGGTSQGGRLMLGYTPTDALLLRFTLTHQDDDYGYTDHVLVNSDKYEFFNPYLDYTRPKLTSYNITAEYDFGPAALTSSSTYADQLSDMSLGGGLFIARLLLGLEPEDFDFFTEFLRQDIYSFAQEIRLTSQNDSRLKWVAGLFWFQQDWREHQFWEATPLPGQTLPVPGLVLDSFIDIGVTEQAVFGELTYQLADHWDITLGGRYFDNKFALSRAAGGTFGATIPFGKVTESAFAPKAALSYKPSEDVNLYAIASQGYRVGQRNFLAGAVDPLDGFVVPDLVETDELWNYELGVKSSLMQNRLRLNLATYFIDWKNIQLEANSAFFNFSANAGDAEVYGAELEFSAKPANFLELGGTFTYNHTELVRALPNTTYVVGDRLPASPETFGSVFIQLSGNRVPFGESGYFRLDHSYKGSTLDQMINATALESDSYHVFNARAGVYFNNIEAVLFVDNLANNDAFTNRTLIGSLLPPDPIGFRLEPRTVGVTLRARF
jgi:iron complex outermembrane recepter protein